MIMKIIQFQAFEGNDNYQYMYGLGDDGKMYVRNYDPHHHKWLDWTTIESEEEHA